MNASSFPLRIMLAGLFSAARSLAIAQEEPRPGQERPAQVPT